MDGIATWKKMYGDYISLIWNGIAFGMLGDVTSWREVDNETEVAADGPGGPPPNVSWSENIIFANMFSSSVNRWFDYHKQILTENLYGGLSRLQAGLPSGDDQAILWASK